MYSCLKLLFCPSLPIFFFHTDDDYVPMEVRGHFRERQPQQPTEVPGTSAASEYDELEPIPDVPHCGCKYNEGQPCHTFFLNKTLQDFRLCMLEKTKEELDFIVLSKLSSGMHMSETTTRSRKKAQSPRVAQRTDFFFMDIGFV